MPLTAYQSRLLADLASPPNDDRYLAGGAALHFAPASARYSNDFEFFSDSFERVARAFATDRERLGALGYACSLEISQPGFLRALVSRGDEQTRVDWAHDSAWRFMPLQRDPQGGLVLHDVDLAVNKALALAGRDEARDFVDILFIHARILPLGAVVWAAVGKDPGFTPRSLLELLKRRGRFHVEDFSRLDLAMPFDVANAKRQWLDALTSADAFARTNPPEEIGCLYWNTVAERFVMPDPSGPRASTIVPHFGRPAGVLPRIVDG
ncbi:MAG: hypothetical protein FJ363_11425 [Gemmatimonadetes bacterium]|nr:hypothetical protein [Gemmatimonadota bacterium]